MRSAFWLALLGGAGAIPAVLGDADESRGVTASGGAEPRRALQDMGEEEEDGGDGGSGEVEAPCPELQFTVGSTMRGGHITDEWCYNIPDISECETYYVDPSTDFDPAAYASYPYDCSQGCGRCALVDGRCTAAEISYGCPSPPMPPAPPPSSPPSFCPALQVTLGTGLRRGRIEDEWCYNLPINADCESYYVDPISDFDPDMYTMYPFDCSQGCAQCVLVGGRCVSSDDVVYGCDEMGSGDGGSGDEPPVDIGSPPPPADMEMMPPSMPVRMAACPDLQFTMSLTQRGGHVANEWCYNLPINADCESYYIDPVTAFDPAEYASYPFDCSQGCGRCVIVDGRCTADETIVYGCPSPPPAPPSAPIDDVGDGDTGSGEEGSGDFGSGDSPSAPLCPELEFTTTLTPRSGHVGDEWCYNVPDIENCERYYVDPMNAFEAGESPEEYPFDCSKGCGQCVLGDEGERCMGSETVVYGCPPPASLPAASPAPPATIGRETACPAVEFTVDRVRLAGQIDGSFCFNAGVGILPFNEASKVFCETFYVDPVVTAPLTDGYPLDCSLGCSPCVYEQVVGTDFWRCTSGLVVLGCPI